ncbi:GNAT family N-acetyltransferase [Actinacidiphila oryziradicis]|uniref:GNAT family N-acetyltransferase n=1 Tax=Actinacidiphila oryziradicis TaxID=2571141 RepID=A0A4U0S9L8_9ACTN|nr:GNAT family N-acetyltransferase [Actinacidiphila oryziradicis]TKA04917.1 GNAT family N-acetyltransferase [Actinacidiphila oryziradicis]
MTAPALATREARPGDWPLVDAFHQRCSTENLHRRWGRTVIGRRDWDRLRSAATCWITTAAGNGEVIALTSLGPLRHEPGCVDLGLQVADAHHGSGIGTALAHRAACQARAAGAYTLAVYTQATNAAMLAVLRSLGATRERRDGSHLDVRLPLHRLSPSRRLLCCHRDQEAPTCLNLPRPPR